mgnify:CR=1 FL=1
MHHPVYIFKVKLKAVYQLNPRKNLSYASGCVMAPTTASTTKPMNSKLKMVAIIPQIFPALAFL